MPKQIMPADLCKTGKEDGEQSALICWTALADVKAQYPDAIKIFAINNNAGKGDREKGSFRGMQARMMGVKAGVCDLFLPVPITSDVKGVDALVYAGLFIEMKQRKHKPKRKGSKGGVADVQASFIAQARNDGYACAVCYGWEEAAQVIMQYLSS